MRRPRRLSRLPGPVVVAPDMFDAAADALGFTLDDAQNRAANALSDPNENVYLWGPVGRGKSWLMATYFAALPSERKRRVHFHEFFRDLHQAIRRNGNDLPGALDDLLDGLDVVCFDEFHVHDPADGIFLARTLPVLLDRRIRMVLTSNYPPRTLLPNPLFHDDFVPTIEVIEQHFRVVPVDGPLDYRTISDHATGFAAGSWITPGTPAQLARLGLDEPSTDEYRTLAPAGHPIGVRRATGGCVWIDFAELCEKPTAPTDYLGLAREFTTWVIGGVPDLRTVGSDPAQRFANVIDVLYDHDVTCIVTASRSLDAVADSDSEPLDIARVSSRLGQLVEYSEPT